MFLGDVMKALYLSALAILGSAGLAAAADLPERRAAPAFAAVPAFTWTGFYVGGSAGYMWSDSDMKLADVGVAVLPIDVAQGTLPRNLSVNRDGALAGVQAGYNVQFGTFVAGLEADISWTNVEGDALFSAPDRFLFPGALTNTAVQSDLDWLGTLRARAGVTVDRALFYVTGGAAVGEVKNTFSIAIPGAPAPLGPYFSPKWSTRGSEWGWTIGAGVEYALTNNISLKAEYLYYDLADQTIRGTDGPNFGTEFIDYKFKNDGNIVRGGVNVRF
jgi:outer membrane immunogenic protein